MIRKALLFLTLAGIGLCCGTSALADNIHLCDINSTTPCDAGSVIPIYGNLPQQTWVFGTGAPSGTEKLWIAVLTPQSTGSGFNGNTNLWAALGFGTSSQQNFPNFSSTHDQELGATGINAASFNVTSILGVNWTGSVLQGQTVTLPNEPVGTIFIAYLVDSSGNLVAVSPWSSAMIFVPEPSSLALLGIGLLGLGVLASRRFLGN